MLELEQFKDWLAEHTNYSKATISDMASRVRRADNILPWFNDEVYLFHLEQNKKFQRIENSVRSQIKKAIKLYLEFLKEGTKGTHKILSLFANIGVAEAYLQDIGFNVVVANELISRRANLYSKIYPETEMICGDITDSKIYKKIIESAREHGVDMVMATPPCQGMSTAGQQDENDKRNMLIVPVIHAIHDLQPKYVFIENVPMFLNTSVVFKGKKILIPELLDRELSQKYTIRKYVINTADYSVPQTRERAIILMTHKEKGLKEWLLPSKDTHVVTMKEAIGSLPKIDPYVDDVSEKEFKKMFPKFAERERAALAISKWNIPPHHVKRQVIAMQHTPTGCSAFDNEQYFPIKKNGVPARGYRNTYKRQNWNTAAYTVTMDNRKISSQNNVHPGRKEGIDKNGHVIYSDPRALTLYEIMIIMSIPNNWPIPSNTSEAFLRRIIGEGIPPLFVKKTFANL